MRIRDQSFLALLTFVFSIGVLGSAAETAAFTVSPLAYPRKTIDGSSHSRVVIDQASSNVEEETTSTGEDVQPEFSTTDRLSSKQIIPTVGLASLSLVSLAAKVGLLGHYTDTQIAQDVGAALLTGTLGYVFVKGNTWLAEKGYLDPRDSRKIIHTLSAPLFILFWPIFSTADGARYFAATVSFVNIIRLYIAGSGGDKSLAYAVSR
jgi:hypothetical protein